MGRMKFKDLIKSCCYSWAHRGDVDPEEFFGFSAQRHSTIAAQIRQRNGPTAVQKRLTSRFSFVSTFISRCSRRTSDSEMTLLQSVAQK